MRHNATLAVLIVALGMSLGACKKKAPIEPTPAPAPAPVVELPPPAPKGPPAGQGQKLERLYFGYDSVQFEGGSDALTRNVEILQKNPETRIEVQGHADERGTTEYNLALGQRRAEAVKDRMVRMGVPSARLSTISYGEERPQVNAANESAYAQNRRAEFRVLSTGASEAVEGTVR